MGNGITITERRPRRRPLETRSIELTDMDVAMLKNVLGGNPSQSVRDLVDKIYEQWSGMTDNNRPRDIPRP